MKSETGDTIPITTLFPPKMHSNFLIKLKLQISIIDPFVCTFKKHIVRNIF